MHDLVVSTLARIQVRFSSATMRDESKQTHEEGHVVVESVEREIGRDVSYHDDLAWLPDTSIISNMHVRMRQRMQG